MSIALKLPASLLVCCMTFAFVGQIFAATPVIQNRSTETTGRQTPPSNLQVEISGLRKANDDLEKRIKQLENTAKLNEENIKKTGIGVDAYINSIEKLIYPIFGITVAGFFTMLAALIVGGLLAVRSIIPRAVNNAIRPALEKHVNSMKPTDPLNVAISNEAAKVSMAYCNATEYKLSKLTVAAILANNDRADYLDEALCDLDGSGIVPRTKENLVRQRALIYADFYGGRRSKYGSVLAKINEALKQEHMENDSALLEAKGIALRKMGNYDEAVVSSGKAVEAAREENKYVWIRLWSHAFNLYKKGDFKLGVSAGREAREHLPDNDKLRMVLLNCLARTTEPGDLDEAISLTKFSLQRLKDAERYLEAYKFWLGCYSGVQNKINPVDYGFAQFVAT